MQFTKIWPSYEYIIARFYLFDDPDTRIAATSIEECMRACTRYTEPNPVCTGISFTDESKYILDYKYCTLIGDMFTTIKPAPKGAPQACIRVDYWDNEMNEAEKEYIGTDGATTKVVP